MDPKNTEIATFGGGCFWCLEAVFEQVEGVQRVVNGYAGGKDQDPSYEDVCSGTTGHAEVVQITFEPTRVSFPQLLEIFFSIHDPTTPNRQGNDVGTQYRSVIFHHSPDQEATARAVMKEIAAEDTWGAPLVTQLAPFQAFYLAEAYHQGYYRRNPYQGYCVAVVRPKVAKFRAKWASKLKTEASRPPQASAAP